MRITVEIDAIAMKRIQKLTGETKKSPAVSQALNAYLRQQARREFIERALSGRTELSISNEELEARDVHEAR
jgi:Arc/MetJ family transcription regulator